MSRTPQRPSGSASIERSGLMTRRAALKAMLGIYAQVHLVSPKSIARSEGKAKRVIDKRKI